MSPVVEYNGPPKCLVDSTPENDDRIGTGKGRNLFNKKSSRFYSTVVSGGASSIGGHKKPTSDTVLPLTTSTRNSLSYSTTRNSTEQSTKRVSSTCNSTQSSLTGRNSTGKSSHVSTGNSDNSVARGSQRSSTTPTVEMRLLSAYDRNGQSSSSLSPMEEVTITSNFESEVKSALGNITSLLTTVVKRVEGVENDIQQIKSSRTCSSSTPARVKNTSDSAGK